MSRFDEMMKNVEAAPKKEKVCTFEITITTGNDFCGIGAGGVQFANGKGITHSQRLANWYREHDGYEVADITQ